MSSSRARYLIDQLLSNRLSSHELDELLATVGYEQMNADYSEQLEKYFYELLQDQSTPKEKE